MSVNLNKNGSALKAAYEDVLRDDSDTTWAVFGYEGNSNELKVVETGDGGLEDVAEELNGGKAMYAFVRVIDPNTQLPKYVLINWMGEGVPTSRKGVCARHVNDVARFLRGAHVTINARNEDDVDSDTILDKVAKASGANFSFHKEKAKPMPEQGQIGSVYKKANPQQEINVKTRDEFWSKQEREEEQRVAREKKASEEARKQEEIDRRQREKEEGRRREEMSKQRARQIDEQKKRESEQQRQEREEAESRLQSRLKREEQEVDSQLERERTQAQQRQAQERSVSSGVRGKLAGFEKKVEEQRQEPPRIVPKHKPKQPPPPREPEPQYEPEPEPQYEPEPEYDPEPEYEPEPEPEYEPEPEPEYEPEPEPEPLYEPEPEESYDADQIYDDVEKPTEDTYGQLEDAYAEQQGEIYDDVQDQPQGLTARTLYDYEADDDTEISFDVDEIILDIEQIDEGWWRGTRQLDGSNGLFPANYVELI